MLRHGRKDVLDAMLVRGEKEYASDRAFVEKRKVKTFNDLIVEQPWDVMNTRLFGKANGCMTIFHPTWLRLLEESPVAKAAYENSKYQKDLDTFITTKLSKFIYKS
jgi:hypothetical protein